MIAVGPVSSVVSFLWGGTWSFVLPPRVSEFPLALLLIAVIAGYLRAIARTPFRPFEWIWPLTLVFFAAGIIRQALILFVELSSFNAPAWYLHSFVSVFSPMVGLGVAEMARWRRIRPLIGALLIYPMIFLPFEISFRRNSIGL